MPLLRSGLILLLPFFVALAHAGVGDGACERGLLPGMTPQQARVVDQFVARDLEPTEALARAIFRLAPAAAHEFVLVGKSPTLLGAYFDAQKKHFPQLQSWSLPLSLKNEGALPKSSLLARFKKVFDVFRQVPAKKDARLVFIDAIQVGRTFIALDRLLAREGQDALFIGFSDDPRGAEDLLRQANLSHPFKIIAVSPEYMQSVSEHKVAAPYASYALEASADPVANLTKAPVANTMFLDLRLQIEHALAE